MKKPLDPEVEAVLCDEDVNRSVSPQSTFVNRPALGILPPENFPDKVTESLLSVSNATRAHGPSVGVIVCV